MEWHSSQEELFSSSSGELSEKDTPTSEDSSDSDSDCYILSGDSDISSDEDSKDDDEFEPSFDKPILILGVKTLPAQYIQNIVSFVNCV